MLAPGTQLGPYQVLEKIGEGGMGEVYKARDTRLDRIVALKLLVGEPDEVRQLHEQLRNEARALSQINHPNICTLYDIGDGQSPNGPVHFLVMEFVEGETLDVRLRRGPLPMERALTLGAQIAGALDKAHRAGIRHGDLKPSNIMLASAGVKLLDFGLARRLGAPLPHDWADAQTRTVTFSTPGSITGTLQYLSPEQIEGKQPDGRSDIFACGAVLFEMMTARRAFEGNTPAAIIAAIMSRDVPRVSAVLPGVSPQIDHVVGTCLAKDPDDRWQHAGDLMRELTWLGTVPSPAADAARSGGTLFTRPLVLVAGILLIAAVALAALAIWPSRIADTPVYRTSILLPEGLRFPSAGTLGGAGRLALSPDGRTLAVVLSDPSGSQMLWLRSLDGQMTMPVPGTEGASSPFWSPDSNAVAFIAQGQLRTVDTRGGQPVMIAAQALNTAGAWLSNDEILFTPSNTSPLSIVSTAGGAPRQVTRFEASSGDLLHRSPSPLPGGRRFLYVAVGDRTDAGTRRALYVGSLDGTPPVMLLDNVATAKFLDGVLLFLRDNALFAQPFDPDRLTLSGEPQMLTDRIEATGPTAASFSLSNTGVLAYQPSSQAASQLIWFDRQGRQLGVVGDPADYGDLELSPDGRLVAVSIVDAETATRDIWIVDVARGVRSRITFDKADDVAPVWSRDGSKVLFASNRSGRYDLYEKAANGLSPETLVFADGNDKYPTSWLSNARALLFWTFNTEGAELKLLSLDGEHRATTFLPSPVSPARISPDERYALYISAESGRSEVYMVPFPNTTGKWQVSTAGGNYARWRHDGREIFYVSRDNKLVATPVSVEGGRVEIGQPVPLFDARPIGTRYPFDVAADGDRFLVNTARGASAVTSVTIVQNWRRLIAP